MYNVHTCDVEVHSSASHNIVVLCEFHLTVTQSLNCITIFKVIKIYFVLIRRQYKINLYQIVETLMVVLSISNCTYPNSIYQRIIL